MRSPRYTILIANRKTGAVRRLTVVAPRWRSGARGRRRLPPLLLGLGARGADQAEIEALRSANENLARERELSRRDRRARRADFVAPDGADAARRAGAARSATRRRAGKAAGDGAVARDRRRVGADRRPRRRPAPSTRRTARSASCANLLGALEIALAVGQDARSKTSRRWRARRRRSGRSSAGSRRRSATARIRSPAAGLPSRPRYLRRSRHAGPRDGGRHGRVGRLQRQLRQLQSSSTTASASRRGSAISRASPSAPARRSSAATSSATSAPRAAPPSAHLHYEILLNGQPHQPAAAARQAARPRARSTPDFRLHS